MRDRVLILSVLIVASCGLGYELISSALASYLLGDSILQFSSVIGCYLFAMGIGSWLSKYVKDEDVLNRFIDVELLVALLGGVSAAVLFLVFAWLSAPFRAALYVGVFVIGLMVGMEIPLVMRVFNQRKAEFREIVSRVLTFDYLGALAVSLVFPLLLAPKLGLLRTSFLFGMLNAGVALWTTWLFRAEVRRPAERGARRRGAGPVDAGLRLFRPHDGLGGKGPVRRRRGPCRDHALPAPGGHALARRPAPVHQRQPAILLARRAPLPRGPGASRPAGPALGPQRTGAGRRRRAGGARDSQAPERRTRHAGGPGPGHDGPVLALRAAGQAEPGRAQDPRVTVINDDAGRWLESHAEVYDYIVVDFPTRPTSAWAGCTLCPSTT